MTSKLDGFIWSSPRPGTCNSLLRQSAFAGSSHPGREKSSECGLGPRILVGNEKAAVALRRPSGAGVRPRSQQAKMVDEPEAWEWKLKLKFK